MTYYILCKTFRQAVITAKTFANHYSKEGSVAIVKRQTEVKIGDNQFVFLNENDPRSKLGRRGEFIPVDKFLEKYFTPKKQSL